MLTDLQRMESCNLEAAAVQVLPVEGFRSQSADPTLPFMLDNLLLLALICNMVSEWDLFPSSHTYFKQCQCCYIFFIASMFLHSDMNTLMWEEQHLNSTKWNFQGTPECSITSLNTCKYVLWGNNRRYELKMTKAIITSIFPSMCLDLGHDSSSSTVIWYDTIRYDTIQYIVPLNFEWPSDAPSSHRANGCLKNTKSLISFLIYSIAKG